MTESLSHEVAMSLLQHIAETLGWEIDVRLDGAVTRPGTVTYHGGTFSRRESAA